MRSNLMIFALIGLIGCVRTAEPNAPILVPLPENGLQDREPDSCGATDLASLIGQPEGMIRTVPMTQAYRVIPPGAIVTQEYSASRVNFYLDDTDIIERISCG